MLNKGAQSINNKDLTLYKQLPKLYDAKNYKKGLKTAEKVLETNKDHPETLAMKGLFELNLNMEKEALQHVKLGLIKSSMKSMFCWHALGTINKHKREYQEAGISFSKALNLDPDNIQVLREAACCYMQARDYQNYVSTAYTILKLKPNLLQSWAGFVVGYHMKEDYPSFMKTIASFENVMLTHEIKPNEKSHYYLYKISVHQEQSNYQQMFADLNKYAKEIKDETLFHDFMVRCAKHLGKKDELKSSLDFLLKKYPENVSYLKEFAGQSATTKLDTYREATAVYKSKIAKVYALCEIQNPIEFKQEFAVFIKPYYQKNLVSLMSEIKPVYNSGKHTLIGEVFNEHYNSLKNGAYPDGSAPLTATEYLWSTYLLAQHLGLQFDTCHRAIQLIEEAISHTCTVTEFYMVKADILYKMHNNFEALETSNEARKTDLADRYLNNFCVKFLLRCQKQQLAQEMVKVFMRDEASVYELQTQWYILQTGKSMFKAAKINAGLSHMNMIHKQFHDMLANEYDFHSYCLRKWTLKEYVELLRFNDNIWASPIYLQAATHAIRYLFQLPFQKQTPFFPPKEQPKTPEHVTLEAFRDKIDYYGVKYAEKVKADPMQQAYVYAKNIASAEYIDKNDAKELQTFVAAHAEAISVFIHHKKSLLVLQCIKKMQKIQPDQRKVHVAILRGMKFLETTMSTPNLHPLIQQNVKVYLQATLKGRSLVEYHNLTAVTWPKDNESILAVLQGNVIVAVAGDKEREGTITALKNAVGNILKEKVQPSRIKLDEALKLVHKLEFYGEMSEQLRTDLDKYFTTLTSYFSPWLSQIDNMNEWTWTMWWLSKADQEKEVVNKDGLIEEKN